MFKELTYISGAWKNAFSNKAFRNQLLLTLLVFIAASEFNFHYLRIYQERSGTQINDLVLNLLRPHDFSLPIFLIEYCTLLVVFIFVLPQPEILVKGLQMTAIILVLRTWTVYLFPLEPPRDMIILYDPVANFFLHTKGVFVTKDLFFSGHISLLALLTFISVNKYVKGLAFTATILVGGLIMCQHVHYTLDVLFAPVAAFTAYKFVLYAHRASRFGLELQEQNW